MTCYPLFFSTRLAGTSSGFAKPAGKSLLGQNHLKFCWLSLPPSEISTTCLEVLSYKVDKTAPEAHSLQRLFYILVFCLDQHRQKACRVAKIQCVRQPLENSRRTGPAAWQNCGEISHYAVVADGLVGGCMSKASPPYRFSPKNSPSFATASATYSGTQ